MADFPVPDPALMADHIRRLAAESDRMIAALAAKLRAGGTSPAQEEILDRIQRLASERRKMLDDLRAVLRARGRGR